MSNPNDDKIELLVRSRFSLFLFNDSKSLLEVCNELSARLALSKRWTMKL